MPARGATVSARRHLDSARPRSQEQTRPGRAWRPTAARPRSRRAAARHRSATRRSVRPSLRRTGAPPTMPGRRTDPPSIAGKRERSIVANPPSIAAREIRICPARRPRGGTARAGPPCVRRSATSSDRRQASRRPRPLGLHSPDRLLRARRRRRSDRRPPRRRRSDPLHLRHGLQRRAFMRRPPRLTAAAAGAIADRRHPPLVQVLRPPGPLDLKELIRCAP